MTRAALAVLYTLAGVCAAHAQTPASGEPQVRAYVWDTSRIESWSFFEPPASGGDPTYTTFANRATLGVRVTSRTVDLDGAFQYAQVVGLSERSLGPGALGSGGFYFFSAEAPAAYQLYFKTLNLRVHDVVPGLSIGVGRMGYSSGEESASGDEALDSLRRERVGSRLIGDFEWSVFQRSFDAVRIDIDRPGWAANGSLMFPTQGGYEESANPSISALRLLTVSATVKPRVLPHHVAQVFAYHYRDRRDLQARPDNALLGARRADVSIATFGASSVGVVPLAWGAADTVVWLAGQTGDWYGQAHHAFSAAVEGGYRFDSPWRPWVRAGFLHASGDPDGSDARHQTFFQMVPSLHRYSRSTTYALMNLRDLFADVRLEPHPRVALRGELHRLMLASAADRWYYGSGATSRDAQFFGFTTHPSGGVTRLGTMSELAADVSIKPSWSMNAYFGWMRGGGVVRRSFVGDRLMFFQFENVLRF